MSINSISNKIAEYLSNQTNYNKEVLSYGLEVIIGFLFKILVIIGLSYVIGLIYPIVVIFIFAAALRTFSGGPHCSSYRRCLISELCVFLPLAFSISIIDAFVANFFYPFTIATYIFMLVIILIWVPGASENKSFETEKKKNRFKIYSFVISSLGFIIINIAYHLGYNTFYTSSLIGFIWQSFSVTPIGYFLLEFLDRSLEKFRI